MIARLRGIRQSRDAGITLAEMLVAIVLMGVVGTLVASFFVSTTRTVTMTTALSTNTRMASNGMTEISRIIRAGTDNEVKNQAQANPAFVVAGSETVTMYAYVNLQSSEEKPIMVRFSIDSQRRLVEEIWPGTSLGSGLWSFPATTTTPTTKRFLATSVATAKTGGPFLFTYVDAAGVALPFTSGTVAAADLPKIAAVTVRLSIQGSLSDTSSSVTLLNTVGIPNLGMNRTVT